MSENKNTVKRRLEFGNPVDIALARQAEHDALFPSWKVEFRIFDTVQKNVQAQTEDEAIEIAKNDLCLDDFFMHTAVTKL
jgi:hypothetical protein